MTATLVQISPHSFAGVRSAKKTIGYSTTHGRCDNYKFLLLTVSFGHVPYFTQLHVHKCKPSQICTCVELQQKNQVIGSLHLLSIYLLTTRNCTHTRTYERTHTHTHTHAHTHTHTHTHTNVLTHENSHVHTHARMCVCVCVCFCNHVMMCCVAEATARYKETTLPRFFALWQGHLTTMRLQVTCLYYYNLRCRQKPFFEVHVRVQGHTFDGSRALRSAVTLARGIPGMGRAGALSPIESASDDLIVSSMSFLAVAGMGI